MKHLLKKGAVCLAFITGLVGTAQASIIDQVNLPIGTSFNVATSSLTWQQEVISGVSGTLVGVEFFVGNIEGNGQFNFSISKGLPWQLGPHDFSIDLTGTLANTSMFVDTSLANITLGVGESYVLFWQASGISDGVWLKGSLVNNGVGAYPGELWLNNTLFAGGGYDFGFRTFMEPVPEPSTILLLGSGLVGLIGYRMKKAQV